MADAVPNPAGNMTDIVERMRSRREPVLVGDVQGPRIDWDEGPEDGECVEAADEITRLRAEVERLNLDLAFCETDLAVARQDNASFAEPYKALRAENTRLRAALEIRFPVKPRKMWSGDEVQKTWSSGEVQKWLDDRSRAALAQSKGEME